MLKGAIAWLFVLLPAGAQTGYVNPKLCAGCHAAISKTYQQTGMGRSFSRPDLLAESTWYHEASDTHFEMVRRDGAYVQRRYQTGFDGSQTNVEEKQVDFVLGSGNHARTYLHRTARGTLQELPLGWYAEAGGHWGMNPGYDRPDQAASLRLVTYECMFCHNAYPAIPQGHDGFGATPVFPSEPPLGIDCQRCHGPGARHVQAAQVPSARPEEIRGSIVNPARLPAGRKMEVCLQCHLETTSFVFPHSVMRYERGPFSYRPGQSLGDFLLFFDHAAGAGKSDKFEIAGAAYRLRQSACFRKSNGALECTTCHNPHDAPRGEAAVLHYNAVCRQCHTAGGHTAEGNCTGCHMPPRRTEDAVHVVMTDHYIQRKPPERPLVGEIAERHETAGTAYRGGVVPYYPEALPRTPENELYIAVAQVREQNNLAAGVAALSRLLPARPSARPEWYLELADAWRDSGQPARAVPQYQAALQRRPEWVLAWRKLGVAQEAAGKPVEAVASLRRAVQLAPNDADAWHELGQLCLQQGRLPEAASALQKALALDPEIPEAHNALGVLWGQSQDPRAVAAFREAIRLSPAYVEARVNLASFLSDPEAIFEFERAVRIDPAYAPGRLAYGQLLNAMRRTDDARQQLEAAVQADPNLADAHQLLGVVLERKGRENEALAEYQAAVRLSPGLSQAHLNIAYILERKGQAGPALEHLREAAKSKDPLTRQLALDLMKKLGR